LNSANRKFVWEDANTSGATVSGSGTDATLDHVFYGSIPPHQNISAGNYSDTINVLVTFLIEHPFKSVVVLLC
jgi:spore coat protein U-like protein